jgi:hypothetical protein
MKFNVHGSLLFFLLGILLFVLGYMWIIIPGLFLLGGIIFGLED